MAFKFNPLTGMFDLVGQAASGGSGGVTSVNGFTGVVNLTTTDIPEGTNLYFTQDRARQSLSGSAPVSYDPVSGIISMAQATSGNDGYLSSIDWSYFSNKAPTDSPIFTGIPTAPTAASGDSSTQIATTAFVKSLGFLTASGSIPTGFVTSNTTVTGNTASYVNALTTTVTLTTSAPIFAVATAEMRATTASGVAGGRITINGVSGQFQNVSMRTINDRYDFALSYFSQVLNPGVYTVNFDFNRASGAGVVNFVEGSLYAQALQGTNSNGITMLTGDVTAGPGSGSQVATIPDGTITNAKVNPAAAIAFSKLASLTSTNILVGSAGNVATSVAVSGDVTITNAGVVTIANLAVTNAKIANTTINLTTKVTGTLPFANGGTGATAFANQRIPFSNATNFVADANFLYDTTNVRFFVGQAGGTGRINGTVRSVEASSGSLAGNFFSSGSNNCLQAQNQNAWTLSLVNAGASGVGATINGEFSRGTLVARTQSKSGDTIFSINAQGHTGAGFATGYSANLSYILSEDTTSTNQGGEMVFWTTPNGTIAPVERLRLTNDGNGKWTDAHWKAAQTTGPTVAANANAGTGATAGLSNHTDIAGNVQLTTGAALLATGTQLTVTFNRAYAVAPIVVLTATDANTGLLNSVYVSSTTGGFSVNAALALTPATSYSWNYQVIETQ